MVNTPRARGREARLTAALAVLNGAIGDYLGRAGNGLAIEMGCVHRGRVIPMGREALVAACPAATPRVAVLVHGLMCSEAVWRFHPSSDDETRRDYGTLLAADLGYTPLYLRYNSGLAIADNGAALAALLGELCGAYPVTIEEILLVGHSLGGLVVRSACDLANGRPLPWLRLVRRTISIGTPHLGSPVERVGRRAAALLRAVDNPYTRLVATIGDLRSQGIRDLGDADLRHDDGVRRKDGLRSPGWRHPVPLVRGVAHYAIAGTRSRRAGRDALTDALVPLASATARHLDVPPERVKVFPGVGHLLLARHPGVYAQIRAWCEEAV